ncbi:G-patch-domain-containing protein [Polyplosphaeria fusca]|uniref:G-patch-domain-containing protein n=1 Tax=Polyplosphaeria fusca TaxID=682080 RepID=A0A9P4R453_9PLEO|nr:G-patch-domain-containing protein [Polyplosphaeria fusca]
MAADDEEEDYMAMVFEDAPKQETSLQRRARTEREIQSRAHPKSKAELEQEAEAAREAGLSTAIDTSSKGFKMMAKFGFKDGDTLGKSKDARREPIRVQVKDDRSGIGLESQKKRKFRERMEKAAQEAKRTKVEEGDYRDRVRQEYKDKQDEREFRNAQKTAERLQEQQLEQAAADGKGRVKGLADIPLKQINVLWRGLVRHRREKERKQEEARVRQNRLASRLPMLGDDEEDADDKMALGRDTTVTVIDDDLDDDDPDLEAFEELPIAERLQKIVLHLQETQYYCYWCKQQYPDAAMEGCPGITEEEHD